jgi:hypothetical protein
VLRGQAAIDAANASTDASPFLVAFWAGIEGVHTCPPSSALANTNALYSCDWLGDVGDQPGLRSDALGRALRIDAFKVEPGPVIVRVHTHDPKLMSCSASYAVECEHVMVGEAAVWSGDEATAPRPTTLSQAAAAFGLPAESSTSSTCLGGDFPGTPVLDFSANSGGESGVVVVFPSAAALAAAAPVVAADGESDIPPPGHSDCAVTTTWLFGASRTSVVKGYWMARGNILVAVSYDTDLGPNSDPLVAQARANLAKLPGSSS